jgi:hypothetical protein
VPNGIDTLLWRTLNCYSEERVSAEVEKEFELGFF